MTKESNQVDTEFALRYAVRVLTRHANLWRNAANALKFLSMLSGTLALGSVMADKGGAAVWSGLLFAVAQCLEHVLSPSEKALMSELQSRRYAEVWAQRSVMDTAALALAYDRLVAADAISPCAALQHLAYDDVVLEQGGAQGACYGGHPVMRVLS